MTAPPPFRRPQQGPGPASRDNIAQWDALVSSSVERATATAEKWRTGLAAFITVVTSILLLKGSDAQKIAFPWNVFVIGLLLAGACLMVLGLWRALQASAPSLATVDYTTVIADHRTVRAYMITVADSVNAQLIKARFWVAWALAVFATGIVAWWLAPVRADSAESVVTVVDRRGVVVGCGTLVESKDRGITLRPNGTDTTVRFQLRDVNAIEIGRTCANAG